MAIAISLHELINFDQAQDEHFRKSADILSFAVNHPNFRTQVLSAPYRETYFRPAGGHRVSKTPAEIVQIITEGLERDTIADNTIDISIRQDPTIGAPVVGSTTPGKLPWRTSSWFIQGCTATGDTISPARHMIHEWLHVAGFVHKRQNGYRKDVAYLVGDIVRKILKQMATQKSELASALVV
ncbi:MAG: hypothetical protein JNN10_08805 [Sphingopyxis sp.]|uniref:hypothetical protein n=1 Tax=Sphingopyxis sp. TaxID=1908224 RepID=UPI001A3B8B7D|nr:hypothetical protein [Sphingopyxis sp.]MBL9066380.1 hypothetical protein [Sphingopyxis sp.]